MPVLSPALSGERKRLALVGHHSAPQVFHVQRELIAELKRAGLGRQLFYAPVTITNANVRAREGTQRTRSFLFASLALVIARMFGRYRFTFYENGVVSLNLPLDRDVLGARATRTTHPRVIRGFEAFFSAVVDAPIEIRTPFQWLTKRDVIELIGEHGFAGLIGKTNSCANPRSWTLDDEFIAVPARNASTGGSPSSRRGSRNSIRPRTTGSTCFSGRGPRSSSSGWRSPT